MLAYLGYPSTIQTWRRASPICFSLDLWQTLKIMGEFEDLSGRSWSVAQCLRELIFHWSSKATSWLWSLCTFSRISLQCQPAWKSNTCMNREHSCTSRGIWHIHIQNLWSYASSSRILGKVGWLLAHQNWLSSRFWQFSSDNTPAHWLYQRVKRSASSLDI